MQRVVLYVDGFNLYYGMREKNWQRYYWLDLHKVGLELSRPGQRLIAIKYFTTIPSNPSDKRKRHLTYLEALQTLPNLHIYRGHFLEEKVECRNCGHTYTTHHEKMTDVNIAVEMLCDAFLGRFEVALLLSADSDLVGPVRAVHSLFPDKHVVAIFPPERWSNALANVTHGVKHISKRLLRKCQFPDPVVKPDGFELKRPSTWT